MGQGKEVSASEVQKLINQKAAPSRIAALDDGEAYFSKDAQKLLDQYKQTYWNTASTGAAQTAAVMGGSSAPASPSTPVSTSSTGFTPGYNPAQSFVEVGPIDSSAFSYGLSNKFSGKLNLPTTNIEGVSEGELSLMLNNMDKSMQYEADYGLRELQGQIDKELLKMTNENDQLKTDKMIDNSIWLDRTGNIAANRQQMSQSNAAMLANL